jgi:hypothetical protein
MPVARCSKRTAILSNQDTNGTCRKGRFSLRRSRRHDNSKAWSRNRVDSLPTIKASAGPILGATNRIRARHGTHDVPKSACQSANLQRDLDQSAQFSHINPGTSEKSRTFRVLSLAYRAKAILAVNMSPRPILWSSVSMSESSRTTSLTRPRCGPVAVARLTRFARCLDLHDTHTVESLEGLFAGSCNQPDRST